MSNQFSHFGLYFTNEQAQVARQVRNTNPQVSTAYTRLRELGGVGVQRQGDVLANAQLYRLDDDPSAGEAAVLHFPALLNRPVRANLLGAAGDLAMLLHCAELLRDHRAFTGEVLANIREQLEVRLNDLLPRLSDDYVHEAWAGCLHLLAGIVLERENWLNEGVQAFYQAIDHEIRPQGFITRAVEGDKSSMNGLLRQVICVKALVLTAEAARASANLDLWGYNVRGVSVVTAALYPIYYFYTTDKWKWDEDLSVETVQAAFRQHGGWLEMLQRRLAHKDLAILLEDLRPIYDSSGGGMTTFTHAPADKPKRRSLFA